MKIFKSLDKSIIITAIMVISVTQILSSQTPYLRHFTVDDGLPSSNVYTAFQDDLGTIWFGTDKGITRFDGYTFETFNLSKVNASTDIWGIYNDPKGRLWFSSLRQLTYLENNEFKTIPFPDDKKFSIIERQFFDDKGNHFIKFQRALRLYRVDMESKKIIPFNDIIFENISFNPVFLEERDNRTLWFITTSGFGLSLIKSQDGVTTIVDDYLFKTNKGIIKIEIKNDKLYNDIILDNRSYASVLWKNKLWIGTKNHLSSLEYEIKGKFVQKSDLFPYPINALKVSKQDKLWIATDGRGLFRFDGVKTDTITAFSDTRITIKFLFIDDSNKLWLSTNKGLAVIEIINETPFKYKYRMFTKANGLITDEVNSIAKKGKDIYRLSN